MKTHKTFWQKYWHYCVMCLILVCFFGFIRVSGTYHALNKFRERLTLFEKPPVDKVVKGGHFNADGTWCAEPHGEQTPDNITEARPDTPKISTEKNQTQAPSHPHDLLTDAEHEELHRLEHESQRKAIILEKLKSEKSESDQAFEEEREFLKLLPTFQERILAYEDYDFIFTLPTVDEIIAKYPDQKSIDGFRERYVEFRKVLKEIADEINKRPAFARKLARLHPEFMRNINLYSQLELPKWKGGQK